MKLILVTLAAFLMRAGAVAQSQPNPANASRPAADAQLYRNPTFNFRYQIPYGWVDRTKEMQEGNDAARGEVLLAVFERPPQAAGDTINSAVVIGAEKAAAGLKKPEDYLGALNETAAAQGLKPEGDPSALEVDSQRLVRANFSKAMSDKLTVHQSTLVLLSKGQVVTFTFIAESADALDDLIEGLGFSPAKTKTK
jgi:hypothetical protein